MRGAILLVALGLAVVLAFPNVVLSDCLTFGTWGPISWHVLDGQTIVFYDGAIPIARVKMQNCIVNASSTIRLIKKYLCDSDKILIDNTPCNIMTITSAASGSF